MQWVVLFYLFIYFFLKYDHVKYNIFKIQQMSYASLYICLVKFVNLKKKTMEK